MSAHFQYARFAARSHRAAADWLRAVDDVVALHGGSVRLAVTPPSSVDAAVGWRLLTENHRELGRSARLVASEDEARHDVARLLRAAETLTVHSAPEPGMRTTGWFACLDDELLMIGARRYENRSVARNAGLLAVRLLGGSRAAAAQPPATRTAGEYVR